VKNLAKNQTFIVIIVKNAPLCWRKN